MEIETTPKDEAEGISSRDSNKAAAAVADGGDTVGHVIFGCGMIIISKMGPLETPLRVLFLMSSIAAERERRWMQKDLRLMP